MLRQIAALGGTMTAGQAKRSAHNPKPPGSVQIGSATHHIIRRMVTAPARWWSYRELAAAVPSRSSFHWALTLLRERGHIEASRSDPHHPRRMRYRLTEAGRQAAMHRK